MSRGRERQRERERERQREREIEKKRDNRQTHRSTIRFPSFSLLLLLAVLRLLFLGCRKRRPYLGREVRELIEPGLGRGKVKLGKIGCERFNPCKGRPRLPAHALDVRGPARCFQARAQVSYVRLIELDRVRDRGRGHRGRRKGGKRRKKKKKRGKMKRRILWPLFFFPLPLGLSLSLSRLFICRASEPLSPCLLDLHFFHPPSLALTVMSERLAVLARHLASPAQGEQEQQQMAAAMPTSSSLSPSAQQLSAFCPRELAKFMTHDNHELRGRIQEFLKVSFRELWWC